VGFTVSEFATRGQSCGKVLSVGLEQSGERGSRVYKGVL